MANPMRTVRVRFDGDAKGLTKAVSDGVKGIQKFSDDVRKNSRSGGIISGIVESIKSGAGQVKDSLSSVFQGGLKGALSTPVVGPVILAALAALAATIAPAAGALIGGAIVLGFGAAITGLGFKLLLENEKIKKQFTKDWASVKKTLSDAFKPLIPVLDVVRSTMKSVAKEFAPFIKQGSELAAGPLKTFIRQLGEAFKRLAPAIEPIMKAFGDLLTAIGPHLVAVFGLISGELVTMSNSMSENKDAFGLLVGLLLTSIPAALKVINLLIVAFGAVVSGAKAVWSGVSTAFNAIKPVVSSVMNAIKTTIDAVLRVIKALFNGNMSDVKRAISQGLSAIRSAWSSAWNAVKSLFLAVWVTIKGALSSAISSLWNGVKGLGPKLLGFVKSLPGKILNALGNIGGLLYGAGANIINGLIRGIQSKTAAVRDKISSVVQTIRNHLPFSPAKEGPLSGSGNPENSGRKIVQMLADGIGSQFGTIRGAMSGVLSGGISAPVMAASGSPNINVRVYLGDEELKGMVRTEISESNRNFRRRALAA